MPTVLSIVEGFGDRIAVPVLIRRFATEFVPKCTVTAPPGIRVPRGRLVKAGEIERTIELAAGRCGSDGGVLVLVDADDDCPAELGPELYGRAVSARPDVPVALVLAKYEFENWFLAAADSLRGRRQLSDTLTAPGSPEDIRAAKGWLQERMPPGRGYSEVEDQPALTQLFDIDMARRAPSFDKCFREITNLLRRLCPDPPGHGAPPAAAE